MLSYLQSIAFSCLGQRKLTNLLAFRYKKAADLVKKELMSCRRVVLAMDCWSKKGLTSSYLAISASFFSPTSHLPNTVLLNLSSISHPHTGEMLAEKLDLALKEWAIPQSKILMVVTDNGSNMIKAIKCLKSSKPTITKESDEEDVDNNAVADDVTENERVNMRSDTDSDDDSDAAASIENVPSVESHDANSEAENDVEDSFADGNDDDMSMPDTGLHRLPCLAHSLQLVLKEIDRSSSFRNVIGKARQLVRSVRISSVATQRLTAKCGLTLASDCSTRWNSCYLMIERLLSVRVALKEVLDDLAIDCPLLHGDWIKLEQLLKILQPFKQQTDILQKNNLALSNVIPCLLELSMHMKDPMLNKQLAARVQQALRQRFSCFLDTNSCNFDPIPAAACLLDPSVAACMLRADTATLLTEAKLYIKRMVTMSKNILLYCILMILPVMNSLNFKNIN
jgi:hypothetical protein